jgi:hypothetical protein
MDKSEESYAFTTCVIPLDALIDCYKADPKMTHQKWVLWACECADRVLDIYQAYAPNDARPAQTIVAARRWIADPTPENADAADAAAYATADAADAARATYAADAAAYATADAADAARTARTAYAARAAYAAAHAAYAAAYAAHAARTAYAAHAAHAIYAAYAADAAARAAADPQAESLWQTIKLMEIYHA